MEFRHEPVTVLDLGGRDANGGMYHVSDLFTNAKSYVTLDAVDEPGVDIVADAAAWDPDQAYDIVISTEVLEHTATWALIIATAFRALRDGGCFVCTAATDPRAPHSGYDGWDLREGEVYRNIAPGELTAVLQATHFRDIVVETHPTHGDVYAKAWR